MMTVYIRLLTYAQALDVIRAIDEHGGYGNIVPHGLQLDGTEIMIESMIEYMEEMEYRFEISAEPPH